MSCCSMEVIDMSTLSRVTAYDSDLEIVFDPEEYRVVRLTCRPVPLSYREYMGVDDSDEQDLDEQDLDHMIIKNQRGEGWT